jgi:hypothetical protein
VSGKGRRTPNGASQRVTGEVVKRLRDIRALWFAVMNDPNHTVADLSAEFYYKVGELIEGKPLAALTYHGISKDRVLEHAEDS